MAGPWEKYGTAPPVVAPSAAKPWEKYATPPQEKPKQPFVGRILPISRAEEGGDVEFDSDAGLLGVLKRSIMLPRQVMDREVDLNTDEGLGRVLEMATVVTPVNPVVRSGGSIIPGGKPALRPPKVKPPTAQQLIKAGDEGFKAVRGMGVEYTADSVKNWAAALKTELEREFHPSLAKKSFKILDDLVNPPTDASVRAPLSGLIAARDNFGVVAQNFNPKFARDQAVASRIIQRLDDFIEKPPAKSVVAGPAPVAAKTYAEARGNYGAGMRSNRLHAIEESAETRAAATNSGRNIGNTLRQRAADVVDPRYPSRQSGFSKEELSLIKLVADGRAGRNAARFVGNLLGGGGGLGATVTGAVVGGGAGMVGGAPFLGAAAGMAAPVIGATAKALDNRLTSRAFNVADKAVRSRSPMFTRLQKNAPMTVISPEGRAAMARALLATELSSQNHR